MIGSLLLKNNEPITLNYWCRESANYIKSVQFYKIKYTLPKSEKVKIEIFNLLGQKVETLLNKSMPSGSHEVEFTAKDLPSGVYYYRIEAGEFQQVRKMILLKWYLLPPFNIQLLRPD